MGERPAIATASERVQRTCALSDSVSRLRYVRGAREEALSRLGVRRVRDLLLHVPHRYLDFTHFSYTGLIDQLEYEGYSTEDATWAVDSCGADWNEQALGSAQDYLDFTSFSYTGLIDQLEYEGFTTEQATYAADSCGADWNEQAAKSAQSYLDFSAFSRDGLIEQLEYEGFTHEQAVFGADSVGL